jgi:phage baseplate assembly protein W
MGARIFKNNEEYKQSGASSELFSDFSLNFLPHPNTGQITRKVNIDAVKFSIRNIVLTNKYERLRNPRFGGNVRRFLFELFRQTDIEELKDEIKFLIENYEPRAKVIEVNATPYEDQSALAVSIKFYVTMATDLQDMDLTLYRVR